MKRNKNNKQLLVNPTVIDVHMYVSVCVPDTNECVWKIFFLELMGKRFLMTIKKKTNSYYSQRNERSSLFAQ